MFRATSLFQGQARQPSQPYNFRKAVFSCQNLVKAIGFAQGTFHQLLQVGWNGTSSFLHDSCNANSFEGIFTCTVNHRSGKIVG